ncbi:Hypothetical protein MVR_LOCUS124 [uncultured virus]|nr:Hypothetical protein MVR_LOCUS124 [uncultured virus]
MNAASPFYLSTCDINGPYNIIRLINPDLKKTVYVMFDVHTPMLQQNRCKSVYSLDVDKFLVNEFLRVSNDANHAPVDFMFEQHSNTKTKSNDQMYITNIDQLFQEIMYYNQIKSAARNMWQLAITRNKLFENVRVHSIDIRYVLMPLNLMMDITYEYWDNIHQDGYYWSSELHGILVQLHDNIALIISALTNKPIRDSNYAHVGVDKTAFNSIINKLLHKYNHINVKEYINSVISNNVLPRLTQVKDMIETILEQLEQINPKISYLFADDTNDNNVYSWVSVTPHSRKIMTTIDSTLAIAFDSIIALMDLYAIRRILDKDYITNAVMYTGGHHSANYINMLVKGFDFIITNASNLGQYKSVEDMMIQVKASKLELRSTLQCSKICGFEKI